MRAPTLLSATVLTCACSLACAADNAVQFHGFVSQGYLLTTDADIQGKTSGSGTYDYNDFGLNVTANPDEHLRVGMQIYAGDLGKYGNDKLQLDWAYGTYELPKFTPRVDSSITVGRFKMGLGLYGDYRDLDMTRTMAFLPQTVYDLAMRDILLAENGVSIAATIDAGGMGSFDLSAGSGGTALDYSPGTYLGDRFSAGLVTLNDFKIARTSFANLNWNTPLEGLRLKGSYVRFYDIVWSGSSPIGTNLVGKATTAWIGYLGAEYQTGDLTLAGEISKRYQVLDQTFSGGPFPTPMRVQLAPTDNNGYLLANYQAQPRLAVSAGYNWSVNDIVVPQTAQQKYARSNETRGIVLGSRFDITSHWLVKVEFQRNKGTSLNDYSQNSKPGLYWNLFAIKTTFDF